MPAVSRVSSLALAIGLIATAACSDAHEPNPPSRIAEIEVSPDDTLTVDVGSAFHLSPTARDTSGQALYGLSYQWSSSQAQVATVTTDGLVRAVGEGTTRVSATREGVSGYVTVVVTPTDVVAIDFLPGDLPLMPHSQAYLGARGRTATGEVRQFGALDVLWSSSDSSILTLRQSTRRKGEVVSALRAGTAVLTARRGPVTASIEVQVEPRRFRSISTSGYHACAIIEARAAYCWGHNTWGELGGGLPDSLCGDQYYCNVQPLLVVGVQPWSALEAGFGHSCGVTTDSRLWCWGVPYPIEAGGSYCLPMDSDLSLACWPEPALQDPAFSAIEAWPGGSHGCALSSAGVVGCWGDGRGNLLGTSFPPAYCTERAPGGGGGEYPCAYSPAAIADAATFTAVRSGASHTCALTTAGEIHCWGSNQGGRLGRGTLEGDDLPGPVDGARTYSALDAGSGHTCALSEGHAFCWGENADGQLGTTENGGCEASPPAACRPVEVAGGPFTTIAAGGNHTCALDSSGVAWCWGGNDQGQLGTGTTAPSTLPLQVAGGQRFVTLSAGEGATCGLATTGLAYCWGRSTGDGTDISRMVPTLVLGQS
jgi:alpha-tubulin suppressor-like RCC1 family protein